MESKSSLQFYSSKFLKKNQRFTLEKWSTHLFLNSSMFTHVTHMRMIYHRLTYHFAILFGHIHIRFWLLFNVEAFVPGGSLESSASKPWLSEIVPEMHIKSGRDVCLGVNINTNKANRNMIKFLFPFLF